MSPPPFSPNLASPKQCSVLQLHILHFHLQIFAFHKPFFAVKMSITLKFRIVHTLMSKTTRNPVGYLELETDVWIGRSHILLSEKCNSMLTPRRPHILCLTLKYIIEIHFNATSWKPPVTHSLIVSFPIFHNRAFPNAPGPGSAFSFVVVSFDKIARALFFIESS